MFKLNVLSLYGSVSPACMCTMSMMLGTREDQKTVLESLEFQLWMAMNHVGSHSELLQEQQIHIYSKPPFLTHDFSFY